MLLCPDVTGPSIQHAPVGRSHYRTEPLTSETGHQRRALQSAR
jgi:hypothetical protein